MKIYQNIMTRGPNEAKKNAKILLNAIERQNLEKIENIGKKWEEKGRKN